MLVIHNDWYVTMIRKQESRDLDFEAMFCHQCDDSLAGHRFVIIIMVKMKLIMMVRIQQMKALCHQCNDSLAGLLIWGLLKDGGTDNHDDQHVEKFLSQSCTYYDFNHARQKITVMILTTPSLQGTCFARISPTASSATRMSSQTTATSAEKSLASTQRWQNRIVTSADN